MVTDLLAEIYPAAGDIGADGKLGSFCDEFLVHAVDVEGKANGIEVPLASLL